MKETIVHDHAVRAAKPPQATLKTKEPSNLWVVLLLGASVADLTI